MNAPHFLSYKHRRGPGQRKPFGAMNNSARPRPSRGAAAARGRCTRPLHAHHALLTCSEAGKRGNAPKQAPRSGRRAPRPARRSRGAAHARPEPLAPGPSLPPTTVSRPSPAPLWQRGYGSNPPPLPAAGGGFPHTPPRAPGMAAAGSAALT